MPQLKLSSTVLLLSWLIFGCGPPSPAESAPPGSSTNSPPTFEQAHPLSEEDQELLNAQIKLSRSMGLGLLVGAAVIHTATSSCPSPEDVILAGQVSAKLSSRDAWGTPYQIRCPPGAQIMVVSAGPDLSFDTEDDLYIRAELKIQL